MKNFVVSTLHYPKDLLKSKKNFCRGLQTSEIDGKYCTESSIQKVSVFVLTSRLTKLYALMVGLAHEYNSLTANNVRRFQFHGFVTTRSPNTTLRWLVMEPNQCIYSPKSKIHIDLSWQSLFLQELRCADKFNVLIRIIHSTDNVNSVYADASGAEHPGMLINYGYLAEALCLSRSTLQRILKQLESDGYINRIKLGRGKALAQTTQKTCQLRDDIHASSLAAKTNANDFHKLSNNFEVIYTQQKENPGQLNLTGSKNNLGQFYRAGSQELSKVGQIDRVPLNVVKVKNKKTIYSLNQELNSIGQDKPNDCLNVDFFDNDVANGKEHTKNQNTLVAKSDDDLKQSAIAYLQGQCPNVLVSTITETIDALTERFALTSQHEMVNATLMMLGKITEDEAWEYDQKGLCAVVSSVDTKIEVNDSANKNAANLVNRFELSGATSHPETGASLQNNSTQIISESIIVSTRDEHHDENTNASQAEQCNSNSVNLMEVFKACGTDNQNVKKEISTTQTDGGSVVDNTANYNHDKAAIFNQAYHKNSIATLTADDLKMPVVEKEVIRKDWASLADQDFYEGSLPDCQKIALVAIIDYVKRKGVVIGSDTEIYRWLYHTVSNHRHYYSRATSFKHLANILIKQLMNKRFERPSGFNAWEQRLKQQIGCSSMLQKE